MDKLQAIRYFLKLSETLSFKGTAEHFGVPPSTVSRSIKGLEASLGATLVERTTRQVRLTETGDWYRNEVAEPLRVLSAAEEVAEAHSRDPVGTLRLTATQGYGEIRLFSVLERFRATYPKIICDVELTDRYLDLSTGDIDVAIRATADPPEYLVARRLHGNRFVLVASPNYLEKHGRPRVLADVKDHSSIAYRGPSGVYPWMAELGSGVRVQVPRSISFITNHGMQILHAAIAGDGLAFLPIWGVSEALSKGRLEEVALEDAQLVSKADVEKSMLLLYHPQKARLGKVRAVVDFLMEALSEPEEPESDGGG